MLGRAGRLTPGGLRAAVARAVIEVAPGKARERRETAARFARVERWAEDSGNAALMGRELPPDEVLAADQRITGGPASWKAGLDGGMDELRARAFLDLVLGTDSRPRAPRAAPTGRMAARRAASRRGSGRRRGGRVRRAGHADRPARHRGRAGRPARRAGRARPGRPVAGPRPGRRRRAEPEDDLVRDGDRPARARRRARLRPARAQEPPETRRARPPPGGAGFSFTPAGRDGPPGGYGTWRLRVPGGGPGLIVAIDTLDTGTASTGTRPGATTPGSSSGTCPRSGTPPAPARCAAGPPASATSSTTSRTRQAGGPACATAARNAATTTASSSSPGGPSISSPTAPSAGPPRPGAATTPNPPATPSDPRSRS